MKANSLDAYQVSRCAGKNLSLNSLRAPKIGKATQFGLMRRAEGKVRPLIQKPPIYFGNHLSRASLLRSRQ